MNIFEMTRTSHKLAQASSAMTQAEPVNVKLSQAKLNYDLARAGSSCFNKKDIVS